EARVAAQRAAFERSRTTEETYLAVMATPVYVPELDVVAVGPEGEVTAFAIGWVDPVNRHAIFEPVGTHPDHRRKGLAKAVLLEGLRRMKRMGAITAQVGHLAGAEGPRRLYESVGFAPVDLWTRWEKPKPPGR
ncbi:MAG TPA: GNAT family N-acetyltransferase, partial [bacterium]|nr:GNAT family N-acetyltransferase [bacterium]